MTRYRQFRCVYLTQEPVHVGSGGYRLGRVDLTITRDPGSNLPKIPGTSLSGAARSYASVRYNKPEAAGAHDKVDPTHRAACPILFTFGTTSGEQGQAGTVSLGDAHIVLFPVTTSSGPRWITTASLLEGAGWGRPASAPSKPEDICVNVAPAPAQMNLGWLLFNEVKPNAKVPLPEKLGSDDLFVKDLGPRIVVVHDDLFHHLVNSNLEVRTSVVIDPETGAAKPRLLYSYEAIPRATVLSQEVIEDNYRGPMPPVSQEYDRTLGDRAGSPLGETWSSPWDVARAGLKLIEVLGVGGMGTRGFGRMKLVANWEVKQ